MKALYISKYYDRIYNTAGIGGMIVEDDAVIKIFQERYFNMSELNSELMAMIDIIGSIKKEDRKDICVIFPAGRIRKIGIKNILKSVEKGGDDDIRAKFGKFYNDMKEVLIVMSDDKDARNSVWFKYCYRLAFLSYKGIERDDLADIIIKNSTMSANKLYEKLECKRQQDEIDTAKNISEIRKNIRTRKRGFLVMMEGPDISEPEFVTFDEEFAKSYVNRKNIYFRSNKNALNHYAYCMRHCGVMHPSAVTEELLNGTGISLERFKRIAEETVNGRYNHWKVVELPIKN